MNRTKHHFEHQIARTSGSLKRAQQLILDTQRILHDTRNSRYQAALLRTISRMLRRARPGQAA